MNHHILQLIFFLGLVVCTLVLNFFIFLPYVSIVFLAGIIAIIFEPMHTKILAFCIGKKSLAALFSVLVVLIFILTPLSIFGVILFQESTAVYSKLSSGESSILVLSNRAIEHTQVFLERVVPQFSFDIRSRLDLETYAGKIVGWLSNNLAGFFGGVLKGVIGFFLMILALFYFFRDGRRLLSSLVDLSPLFNSYDVKIITKLKTAINSVIRGQLMIAVIQGILTGIGFAIFGVPSPFMWAAVAAVASLVPTLGTSLVLIPAVVFLFFTGHIAAMIGLIIWGVAAVGLVDNLLGPILIERGLKIHPFIILLSVLGGIALFGPVGFIAGPVALSLLFALLDIYPIIIKPASVKI